MKQMFLLMIQEDCMRKKSPLAFWGKRTFKCMSKMRGAYLFFFLFLSLGGV